MDFCPICWSEKLEKLEENKFISCISCGAKAMIWLISFIALVLFVEYEFNWKGRR